MNKLNFELEVYTYQIDIVGHLSNIIYIEWMEIGRLKLLEAIGLPVTELTKKDVFFTFTIAVADFEGIILVSLSIKSIGSL